MNQCECGTNGLWRNSSEEIKSLLFQYANRNKLTPDQLSIKLGCPVQIVYAILNGINIFSLAAINYIESSLNLGLN